MQLVLVPIVQHNSAKGKIRCFSKLSCILLHVLRIHPLRSSVKSCQLTLWALLRYCGLISKYVQTLLHCQAFLLTHLPTIIHLCVVITAWSSNCEGFMSNFFL